MIDIDAIERALSGGHWLRCNMQDASGALIAEVKSLRIQLATAQAALRPFADEAESYEGDVSDDLYLTVVYEDGTAGNTAISVGDLRRAWRCLQADRDSEAGG